MTFDDDGIPQFLPKLSEAARTELRWHTSIPLTNKHWATHIDVLCGDYQNVVWRNLRATIVDRKYFDHAGGENFYTICIL